MCRRDTPLRPHRAKGSGSHLDEVVGEADEAGARGGLLEDAAAAV